MSDSPNALVLPDDSGYAEAVVFPGFPGVYRPGVPVLLSTIELDLMAARSLISDLGLPLVEHAHSGDEEPPVPDANPPRVDGNQPFGDALGAPEAPSDTEAAAVAEVPLEQRTKAGLVEHAAALDPPLELDEKDKKEDLLAAIDAHAKAVAAQAAGGGTPEPPGDTGETKTPETPGGAE